MAAADALRRFWRAALRLSIVVLVAGICLGHADAQLISGQDRAQLLAEQDRLFQQMLRQPANKCPRPLGRLGLLKTPPGKSQISACYREFLCSNRERE